MSTVSLFITHQCKPGLRDAVHAIWRKHMLASIEENAAHLAYAYCFHATDADVVLAYQEYADRAASDAFVATPQYGRYLTEVEPLLAAQPVVTVGKPMWVKGAGDAARSLA